MHSPPVILSKIQSPIFVYFEKIYSPIYFIHVYIFFLCLNCVFYIFVSSLKSGFIQGPICKNKSGGAPTPKSHLI